MEWKKWLMLNLKNSDSGNGYGVWFITLCLAKTILWWWKQHCDCWTLISSCLVSRGR